MPCGGFATARRRAHGASRAARRALVRCAPRANTHAYRYRYSTGRTLFFATIEKPKLQVPFKFKFKFKFKFNLQLELELQVPVTRRRTDFTVHSPRRCAAVPYQSPLLPSSSSILLYPVAGSTWNYIL